QNHRRYGGLIVHLGVVLVAIGVGTSTGGEGERGATPKRGGTLDNGRHPLPVPELTPSRAAPPPPVDARVQILDGGRVVATVQPGQRLYPTSQSPFATVGIRYGFGQDLYVILGEFDREAQEWASVKAQIHPLIAWIWLGGVVVVVGGLVAV